MKYIISGYSGFIAKHLIEAIGPSNEIVPVPRAILYEQVALREFFTKEKPDYIFHLAAYGNHSNQTDNLKTIISNVSATMLMLECSKEIPYKKFVNFSTSSILLPTQTFYSISKATGEDLAEMYAQNKKPVLTVRPFSIYGDGEAQFRFIPTVIRCLIYGESMELDTQATHDWVYVRDFVDTLLLNVDKTGVLNLGTGMSYSNIEIVRKLEKISGKKLDFKEKTMRNYDNQNWVCPEATVTSDVDLGLFKTYQYYAKKFTSN